MTLRLELSLSGRYKKDVNRAKLRGWDINELNVVIAKLVRGEILPAALQDHALKGNWIGYRELHVKPDWLLLYQIKGNYMVVDPNNKKTACITPKLHKNPNLSNLHATL